MKVQSIWHSLIKYRRGVNQVDTSGCLFANRCPSTDKPRPDREQTNTGKGHEWITGEAIGTQVHDRNWEGDRTVWMEMLFVSHPPVQERIYLCTTRGRLEKLEWVSINWVTFGVGDGRTEWLGNVTIWPLRRRWKSVIDTLIDIYFNGPI